MTTYENAPATLMLATHCCVCGRPLLDSDSVEMGIGPTCRGKTGFTAEPNWDAVCTSLGLFAQGTDDMQRLYLFEAAMSHLEDRGKVDTHKMSNLITRYIAAGWRTDCKIGHLIDAVQHMGRPELADILRERLYEVRIVQSGNEDLLVYTPYNDTFRDCMWRGRVGRWDKPAKAYRVPVCNKQALFQALKTAYAGTNAHGPKGEFRL